MNKIEYGFESVNGVVKKTYYIRDIPLIAEKCDVWDELPVLYTRIFTTQKDKNGKEIYAGDIVQCYDWGGKNEKLTIEVVEWDSDEIGWRFRDWQIEDSYDVRKAFKVCEVIGNIYENPELLKHEKI